MKMRKYKIRNTINFRPAKPYLFQLHPSWVPLETE